MWEFLVRQLLKEAGRKAAGTFFNDEANGPEVYPDRIKRDFHLDDYADALALYASNPANWEKWYEPTPSPDPSAEVQHDSVRASGVPSRYNVFEYGYPETSGQPAGPSPAHLGDYQRYLGTPGAIMGDLSANVPNAGPLYGSQAVDPADAAAEARKKMRVLGSRFSPRADLGGYDADAPATVLNQIPSPDRSPSFDDRLGNWVSTPAGTAPLGPYRPVAPPPQAVRPLGIVTGQPMPDIPLPPSVFGLPDQSGAPGDERWSLRRLGRADWTK